MYNTIITKSVEESRTEELYEIDVFELAHQIVDCNKWFTLENCSRIKDFFCENFMADIADAIMRPREIFIKLWKMSGVICEESNVLSEESQHDKVNVFKVLERCLVKSSETYCIP